MNLEGMSNQWSYLRWEIEDMGHLVDHLFHSLSKLLKRHETED